MHTHTGVVFKARAFVDRGIEAQNFEVEVCGRQTVALHIEEPWWGHAFDNPQRFLPKVD